jgi:hypothetical protein
MLQKIVVSTLMSSLLLLTACGGSSDTGDDVNSGIGNGDNVNSGGGNGNDSNSLFKFQTFGLERIEYDYDNNGIAEGVETFSYDDEGKLVLSSFQYTTDGTVDIPTTFGNPKRGFMAVDIIYNYDEKGRLIGSNDIAISNTSQDSSLPRASRTIDFTFEYKDDSEYPMSITESYMDESGTPLYRYTDIFNYDEEDNLKNVVRNYDPSVSTFPIDNPGYLYRVEYDYSDITGSAQNYNYLDEFSNASIFNYSSDRLINSLIVTTDPTLATPPPLSAIVEYSYNDRGCMSNFTGGLFNDLGTIDYKQTLKITYGSQDRVILRELDEDFDGNIDSTDSYFYGDTAITTAPFNAVNFGYPHFYRQGQETTCLTD